MTNYCRIKRITHAAAFLYASIVIAFTAFAQDKLRDELPAGVRAVVEKHCFECHDADTKKGNLELSALKVELSNADNFAKWIKVYERIEAGEMPPKKQARPTVPENEAVTTWLRAALISAEHDKFLNEPRTGVRRLTRAEYENTLRDLFDMPGIVLQGDLPADGSVHGFDKNSEALDISHVNLSKDLDAADRVLTMAIATQPTPPATKIQRVTLANEQSTLGQCILDGDGVMLKNKQPDPDYPPAGHQPHINYGIHLQLGMHRDTSKGASVGVFRQEDESFKPSFAEFIAIYPGMYHIRTSFWSFMWDKGKVLPSKKTLTARLDVWHISGDGRGSGHPNTVLGYFDAPSIDEQHYEIVRWLNPGDSFGFNFTESEIGHQIRTGKDRLMGFTGPGLASEGLELEGPFYEQWPPASHRRMFGELPLVEFKPASQTPMHWPNHPPLTQKYNARNKADPAPNTLKFWTVTSPQPLADADRLLGSFLPKAFRRPVEADVRRTYVALVEKGLKSGDCFEVAMRRAYRTALCSPDFLYHIEEVGIQRSTLDDFSLASRLSYFFWNSMPDDRLMELAAADKLHLPGVLDGEVERLLKDEKSQRFRDDFLGQWLKLRKIAANDPDPKLYSGFRLDLQDAMVSETRAYFQELLDKDLGASYVIKSDFAMLNERLARHYGIPGVEGSKFRRVALPPDSPRGPFLTQAAVLKVTANGTSTSPVPRGAFVCDRLLGRPPEPPPANVAAVEPDLRGLTTIREQLAKHRDNSTCASCHAKMDPYGFALESFDVIGGQRERYRTFSDVKPLVDPSGVFPDGRSYKNIAEFQTMVAADSVLLLKNMADQFAVYGIGRGMNFSDRDQIAAIAARTQKRGGGLRTLLHELVKSELFQSR